MAPGSSPSGRIPIRDYAVYPLLLLLAALVWWLSHHFPSRLPAWAPWEFNWSWFLTATLSGWWYLRGLSLTPRDERPSPWRSLSFAAGVLIIYAVLQTRFEYLAEHMFFLNRVQHIVMHHLGPFLIALAWPGATLKRGMPAPLARVTEWRPLVRFVGWLQQPLLAAFLFVGLVALWLLPPVHFVAMLDPNLYAFMNWTMVVDGVLFWALVLDPRPCPPAPRSFGTRAALAIGVMFPQIVIGAVIAFSEQDLYPFYAWCGRFFPSIGAVTDQKFGGLIIWIPAAMMSVVALILVINALRRTEAGRGGRGGGSEVVSAAQWTG